MPGDQPPQLAPTLANLLAGLRRRIRAYVWAEGLALALVVLGASFWLSLGFDWVFEPPAALRVAVIIAVAAALLFVLVRYILRRAFVRLADRSMAILLERRYDRFHDSLITVVELDEATQHPADFNPELLAATRDAALAASGDVRLAGVFNMRPLTRRIFAALLLVISVIAFALVSREVFGIWARRSLLLSAELWPRQTSLIVLGFDDERRAKIARGSDFELVVQADASPGQVVPEIVEIRYTTSEGARGRENMIRSGNVAAERGARQDYHFTFKGELAARSFYVHGGDDREGPFQLDVVDSPTVNQLILACTFPAYMRRSPRELTVSGNAELPRGTKVVVKARSNKDLVQVQIDDLSNAESPQTKRFDVHGADRRAFEFPLEVAGDKIVLISLFDTDGIRSRDPVRLAIGAASDEAPQVNAQLRGIGTAITPKARLPVGGEISDDYGVASAWFEMQVDDGEPRKHPLEQQPGGRQRIELDEAVEAETLSLAPKQKLLFTIHATDTYDLESAPNAAASPHYSLDVVTPEQLRAMLEARELLLRRRMETIIQEFTDTRDLLFGVTPGKLAVPPSPPPKQTAVPVDKAKAEQSKTFAPASGTQSRAPGAEPEDVLKPRSEAAAPRSLERDLALRLVHLERVIQNSLRSASETRDLGTAFDGIRDELMNNRVDTEELKLRLQGGIADPLRAIAAEMFPALEAPLRKLQSQINDPQAGEAAKAQALAQADAILVRMKQVLDKMLELETFNQVLDRLRAIISLQERLNEQTKEKQKQKLRNLLD